MVDTSGVGAASAFDALQNAQSSASTFPSGSASQSLFDSANKVDITSNNQSVFDTILASSAGSAANRIGSKPPDDPLGGAGLFGGKGAIGGQSSAESVMAQADVNGDGKLSEQEVSGLDADVQKMIEEMGGFDAVAGADAKLDLDELKVVLEKVSGTASRSSPADNLQQLMSGITKVLEGVMSGDSKRMSEGMNEITRAIEGMEAASRQAEESPCSGAAAPSVDSPGAGEGAGRGFFGRGGFNPNVGRIKIF